MAYNSPRTTAAFDPSVPRLPERQAPALGAPALEPARLADVASSHLGVVAPDASDLPGSQLYNSTCAFAELVAPVNGPGAPSVQEA
eukprot:6689397-Alexandrium_andersonii.AAC.1